MAAKNRTLRSRVGPFALGLLLGWTSRAVAAPAGCAFVAATSVRVGNGSLVDGDVSANGVGGTVHLGRRVTVADDTTVAGDTVELWNGASVFDVAANTLERSRGALVRGVISTPDLPPVTPFCPTEAVACGGPDVGVDEGSRTVLTPGSYGPVVVKNGGALTLEPGAYTFCAIRAGRRGRITVGGGAPTTLVVAGEVALQNGSSLAPEAGAPVPHILVAGLRVKISAGAEIHGLVVAGAARVTIGRGTTVVGAICAGTLSTSRNVGLLCADTTAATTTTTSSTTTTSTTLPTSSTTTTTTSSTTTTTSLQASTTSSTSTTAAPTSTSTSTTAAPTTTTSSSSTALPTTTTSSTSTTTSTTTITFPLNCGNGNVNTGETCDDGNHSDNDACPADCRIDACTPVAMSQRFVSVHFAPPEGGLVAGLTLLIDYPEGSVDLPGNATTFPSGTISGVPTGAFVSVNDLNFNQKGHAARITVGAGAALPPGQVVRLRLQDCQGAVVPSPSEFACTVLNASDPFLNAVNGVTCYVVVE